MKIRILAVALVAVAAAFGGRATLAGDAGRSTLTPGLYDCATINLLHEDFSDKSAASLLAHNKNVNHIFEAAGMIDVVDAVPGDGFNGIWQEVKINFVQIAPRQYCNEDDIYADAAAGNITLDYTSEVEICVVVGPHR
jgi:hypothetical protein